MGFTLISIVLGYFGSSNNVSVRGGRGVKQILTFANKGGGGVSEMLIVSC
jgi:hypothetical protein